MLIILSLMLGGWAVWLCRRPSSVYVADSHTHAIVPDRAMADTQESDLEKATRLTDTEPEQKQSYDTGKTSGREKDEPIRTVSSTRINDIDVRTMTGSHPFSAEACKVLSGALEESDSLSRRRILSYCEHLRTAYTTRDIDFLRQVFSDNALIIVGHTVRTAEGSGPKGSPKVTYSLRSKRDYLSNLAKIFDSGKDIDLRFSRFRIMRHPTMEGIYGVTLRQEYSCGGYSDDGWLFLLWDFRNPSMPLLHVRTWQPAKSVGEDEDELIDLSDFNLE